MTCHHRPGDPDCSSHPSNPNNPSNVALRERNAELQRREALIAAYTPDSEKFEIVDVQTVGTHLVMKAQYPNCAKCSYEGTKVMVFLNCSTIDALKWRKIDPHFRAYQQDKSPREAPGPDARFPASAEGWTDALAYANSKIGRVLR